MNPFPRVLVAMLTYNSTLLAGRWLKAWENAEKYGSRLLVVHNSESTAGPPNADTAAILSYKPDIYIARQNIGLDIGAFQSVLQSDLGRWDILIWCTDDAIPMRRDFLNAFIHPFVTNPQVGLVGNYLRDDGYNPRHVRTTAFAVSREFANGLTFPSPLLTKDDCYAFEHRSGRSLYNQAIERQFHVAETMPGVPWHDSNEFIWDVGHLGPEGAEFSHRHDLWKLYFKQFSFAVSIITPWKNAVELIPDYEKVVTGAQVIIIDNASTAAAAADLRDMVERLGGKLIVNRENKWFSQANNQGLLVADADIICFLNSDVKGDNRWLECLSRQVTEGALFGPHMGSKYVAGLELPYIEGWCVAATRRTWDELEGWDAKTFRKPYWEDNDLSFRALKMNLNLTKTDWNIEHKSNCTSNVVPEAKDGSLQNMREFIARVEDYMVTSG
jgi:GT2 family glycosyltransferase